MIRVRECLPEDWPAVWQFMAPVIRAGETYPYAPDMDETAARHLWLEVTDAAYVAEDKGGGIVGTYYLKPNQPSLGAHVANCGYMVAEGARRRGIGALLGRHSQEEAVRRGYRAMQFNLVVTRNEASVNLWEKLGFATVGVLPGAFRHATLGYVDAYVMYKQLVST